MGFIMNGGKETIPNDTPQNIQNIIQQCWKDNPSERISLENILEIIENNENLAASQLSMIPRVCRAKIGSIVGFLLEAGWEMWALSDIPQPLWQLP